MSEYADLEQFIREHYVSLYMVAAKLVGSADTAQDITQEVLARFWENRQKYTEIRSIGDFLFILIRNESFNYLKKIKRENIRYRQLATDKDFEPSVLTQLITEESTHILISAIKKLPPRSARILQLTHKGHTAREIAELTGVSINTVKTLKYNAIRKLRDDLQAMCFTAEKN